MEGGSSRQAVAQTPPHVETRLLPLMAGVLLDGVPAGATYGLLASASALASLPTCSVSTRVPQIEGWWVPVFLLAMLSGLLRGLSPRV